MSSGSGGANAGMVAVVPVRDGVLPLGALETIAECDGVVVLAGSRPDVTATVGVGRDIRCVELGHFEPARWATALAPDLADAGVIVLPGSPDGRDLAPRLAHQLGRPLRANALAVTTAAASVARAGGLALHDFAIDEPVVVTLQPGARGTLGGGTRTTLATVDVATDTVTTMAGTTDTGPSVAGSVGAAAAPTVDEPRFEQLLPPDVTTMDLSEATRIVAGGAGLDGAERFDQLRSVATSIGAAMGATRVVTDRGWVGHERQIGTTGVVVDPALYLAFGISGAVQHTAGLGDPSHVISVNTDEHCPMMQMADLAVVADANLVLDELHRLLGGGDA